MSTLPGAPTLAAIVRERIGTSWSKARALCEQGRVKLNGESCRDPAARVPPDASVVIDAHAPKAPRGALDPDAIVFFDRDVVVVDKPAGMLSVEDDQESRDSLDLHVRTRLRRLDRGGRDSPLAVVHRLDKDTSGVMVFARNAMAQRALASLFRAHDVDRLYVAIAHGHVDPRRIDTYLVPDRGDGLRGSYGHFRRARGDPPATARHAVTHVAPIEPLKDATLIECRLDTGRQHQIRIHLAEMGHPLVGENVYIRDFAGRLIAAPRVMLHARRLGFAHPRTGERIVFEREPPADFTAMLAALR